MVQRAGNEQAPQFPRPLDFLAFAPSKLEFCDLGMLSQNLCKTRQEREKEDLWTIPGS